VTLIILLIFFPEGMWRAYERDMIAYQAMPAFRQVWLDQKSGWSDEYIAHVEELIESHQSKELPNYFQ